MAEMTAEERADLFLEAMKEDRSRGFLRGMLMEHIEQAIEREREALCRTIEEACEFCDRGIEIANVGNVPLGCSHCGPAIEIIRARGKEGK